MYIENVLFSNIIPELSDRFQKRQPLNISDGSSYFDYNNIKGGLPWSI